MEGIWVKVVLPSIIGVLLPTWVSLIWVIPTLMLFSLALGPVLSVGDADILASDIVFLVVVAKIARSVMVGQRPLYRPLYSDDVYKAVAVFLCALLAATIAAGARFGGKIFLAEVIALLRFGTQVAVLPLMTLAVRGEKQVSRAQRFLDYGGYAIAATLYLNIWLLQMGLHFGEVQVHEDMVRYFGPLGDQVGFVLLYFVFKALMRQKLLEAVSLGIAVVLTGTRGTLIALAVGLGVLLWRGYSVRYTARRVFALLAICTALGIAAWFDLGGMRSRFLERELLESGAVQRWLTASIALRVFADNLMTGVGFTGFRYVALDYGAVEVAIEKLGGFAPNFIATAGNQYLQVATDGGLIALGAFIWMILVFSHTLRWAMKHASANQRATFAAGYLWLWSLVLGNQTAAWILPGSLISYLLWLLLGLAVSVKLHARQAGQISLKAVIEQPSYSGGLDAR